MPADRRPGMDHPHYRWDPLPGRPALHWPNGAPVAVMPAILLEVHEDPLPDWPQYASVGGGLLRASPNISRVSTREYGHRVGIFRLVEALQRRGIAPTVALDALTAEWYPFLVRWLTEAGARFIAHGISVNRPLHGGIPPDEERHYVANTLRRLEEAGVRATGWLGPEYGESMITPQVLADAGVSFVCDWCNDEQPYRMTVDGADLVAVPFFADLDDQTTLINRMADLAAYRSHLVRAVTALARDGEVSTRLLAFAVRPWIMGQPFRIGVFEDFLDAAVAAGAWFPGPEELVSTWRSIRPAAEEAGGGR